MVCQDVQEPRSWRTAGGAIPFPGDLPFSIPLAVPLKVTPGEFLAKPLGGPRVNGGQLEGDVSLPLKPV